MKRLPRFGLALSLLASCQQSVVSHKEQPQFSASIIRTDTLHNIPSASALEIWKKWLCLISDDAPGLFLYSTADGKMTTIHLHHLPASPSRVPKPVKADYEAAITTDIDGDTCIIAFGSGSMQPYRESAVIVSLTDPANQRTASLKALYEAMRRAAGIDLASFNIEGAALSGDKVLLLNRGGNHIFILEKGQLLAYLKNETALPSIRVARIQLPQIGKLRPMFSDACLFDEHRLLFSVSVEDTPSWVVDGEVMGSGIGLLDLRDLDHIRLLALAPLCGQDGKIPKIKLEGVSIITGTGSTVFGVVDNDDGSSQLLQIMLRYVPPFH